MDWKSEATWRLASFIGVLVVMSIWESLMPRRRTTVSRPRRAVNNLALATLNTVAVRMLPLLSAVAAAGWAERNSIGLLHQVDWPGWAETVLTLLVLDLLIYGQHVASHKMPMFWRFHRVHHADLDLDATSGLRFHTVEILISMAIKCVAAILLGLRPTDVVLFEIILNATAIFNHSNIRLPIVVDRVLRLFIVTPDMHRVHHSIEREETNTNYGFNLPWWDWIFRTYRGQPHGNHETLPLGLPEFQDADTTTRLSKLLRMPFGR
jgi:sterol desaturase/sphingolipid hydroxylase (fatty acid hydroxylase superfamily)